MAYQAIIWDLDDDPDGNVQHCNEHGISKEEVEEVIEHATDQDRVGQLCLEIQAQAGT